MHGGHVRQARSQLKASLGHESLGIPHEGADACNYRKLFRYMKHESVHNSVGWNDILISSERECFKLKRNLKDQH